jgi:hypothetical protein
MSHSHETIPSGDDALSGSAPKRDTPQSDGNATRSLHQSDTGSGHLEVRCPNCHAPSDIAVDTRLTDLTCGICGSHFSLVDQGQETRMAPSLTRMGRFELIERLGVGGYGSVWKARDKELDRTVAIKIPRQGGMSAEEQEKFFREARAAAQLRHPSIVSVHEVGRDGDSVYIVSDFVRGVTLGDWLTGQQLTSREAAELAAKIADALHHAHEQGVVHRDLKPANVMMDMDNQPHLMDFGLARRDVGEVTVTMDGQVLGTPAYMSPEQAQGEGHSADRRSDVYSLGVILFQLLTGELPFRGNVRMLIHQVLRDEPPSPRKLNGNVPKDLETITLKCLEKLPANRYQSAHELAMELRRFLSKEPIQARPISRLERGWRWCRRNPLAAVLSGALATVLIAALIVLGSANARMKTALSDRETALAHARDKERDARQQAAKATAISELLQSALQSANPDQAKGADYTVRELLDDLSSVLADQLADQPEVEAEIRATIAGAYRRLELHDLAGAQYEAALALCRRADGPGQAKYAEILVDYAQSLAERLQIAEAEQTARNAVDIYRREKITGRPLVKALWILQLQLAERLKYAEEKAVVDEAIAIAQAEGTEYPELANIFHRHAPLLARQGDHEGAEAWAQRAVDMHRRLHGNEHPETAYGLADLGRVLLERNKHREAEAALRESLSIFRRSYDESSNPVRVVSTLLVQAINAQGETVDKGQSKVFERERAETQAAPGRPREDSVANRSLQLAQQARERGLRNSLAGLHAAMAESPGDDEARQQFAVAARKVAELDAEAGRAEEAMTHMRSAVAAASQLVTASPGNASYADELLRCRIGLANLPQPPDEWLAAVATTLDDLEKAQAGFPEAAWPRARAVEALAGMAGALGDKDRSHPPDKDRSHRQFRRAMALVDKTIPAETDALVLLDEMETYLRIGHGLANAPVASDWLTEIADIQQRMFAIASAVEEHDRTPSHLRQEVGHKLRRWAFGLPPRDEFHPSALAALKRSIQVFERLSKAFPAEPAGPHFFADTHRYIAHVHERRGRLDEAEQSYRRGLALFDEYSSLLDRTPVNNSERAYSHVEFAAFLSRHKRGDDDAISELYRKAHQIARDAPQFLNALAWWLVTAPDVQQRDPPEAVKLATKAAEVAPRDANIRNTLGVAQYRAGMWKEAADTLDKAMDLGGGGTAFDYFFAAMATHQLGDATEARQWYDKGVGWMEQYVGLEESATYQSEELAMFRREAAELLGVDAQHEPQK